MWLCGPTASNLTQREVVRRIAYFRSSEKSDPLYYARRTLKRAQADIGRESVEATSMRGSEQIDVRRSSLDKSSCTREQRNLMADQQLLRRPASAWASRTRSLSVEDFGGPVAE
jgi:hypothetical protein